MKKDLSEKITLPEGISAEKKEELLIIKNKEKEQARIIDLRISVKIDGKTIILESKNATKKEKKIMNTTIAHIKNMIEGLENKFVYQLQICSTHFPISVSIDNEKKELIIKNFLGENVPRRAKLLNDVDVKLEKNIITVTSHDKEAAGQTAANIEKSTRIKKRDRRIFQDGIWIISKPTKKIKEK